MRNVEDSIQIRVRSGISAVDLYNYREHAVLLRTYLLVSKRCEKSFKRNKEKVILNLYFNTKTIETTLVGFVFIILPPPLYIAEVRKVQPEI